MSTVIYRVASGETIDKLEELINSAMKDGWVPQGGVTIHNSGSKVIAFHQAMTKEL